MIEHIQIPKGALIEDFVKVSTKPSPRKFVHPLMGEMFGIRVIENSALKPNQCALVGDGKIIFCDLGNGTMTEFLIPNTNLNVMPFIAG